MSTQTYLGVFFMNRFAAIAGISLALVLAGSDAADRLSAGNIQSFFFPSWAVSVKEENEDGKALTVIEPENGEIQFSFKIAEIFRKIFF